MGWFGQEREVSFSNTSKHGDSVRLAFGTLDKNLKNAGFLVFLTYGTLVTDL
jgi:hypothetical protein